MAGIGGTAGFGTKLSEGQAQCAKLKSEQSGAVVNGPQQTKSISIGTGGVAFVDCLKSKIKSP